MNTKKHRLLNGTNVDRVTQIFRAYKHPYRYHIIGKLLEHGQLTTNELAAHLEIGEPYIIEQMAILTRSGLVFSTVSENGKSFAANKKVLLQLKKSVENLV